MFLRKAEISDHSLVTDIVRQDYRTSLVFTKYGIDYCCGGRIPLEKACEIHGVDKEELRKELVAVIRNFHISNTLDFHNWSIDFLIDYIQNVHHAYLFRNLPDINQLLEQFTQSHQAKHPWTTELLSLFRLLCNNIMPHLQQEEEVFFPYIRQIAHAHGSREPYAALLVKTLRKPLDDIMREEDEYVGRYLEHTRHLTNNYTPSPEACTMHRVCLSRLQELDTDLAQHIYLEKEILFTRALAIEKDVLS